MKLLITGILAALLLLPGAPAVFADQGDHHHTQSFNGVAAGSFTMSPTAVTVTGAGLFQQLDLTSISATGTVTGLTSCSGFSATEANVYTAANGDSLSLAISKVFCATTGPTTFQVTGSFKVVGGTGEFAGATGSGTISGTAALLTPTSGIFVYFQGGTLSFDDDSGD